MNWYNFFWYLVRLHPIYSLIVLFWMGIVINQSINQSNYNFKKLWIDFLKYFLCCTYLEKRINDLFCSTLILKKSDDVILVFLLYTYHCWFFIIIIIIVVVFIFFYFYIFIFFLLWNLVVKCLKIMYWWQSLIDMDHQNFLKLKLLHSISFFFLFWSRTHSQDIWLDLYLMVSTRWNYLEYLQEQWIKWCMEDRQNGWPCVCECISVSKPNESISGTYTLITYIGVPGLDLSLMTWPLLLSKTVYIALTVSNGASIWTRRIVPMSFALYISME